MTGAEREDEKKKKKKKKNKWKNERRGRGRKKERGGTGGQIRNSASFSKSSAYCRTTYGAAIANSV